jgi:hypothetical protein
VFHEYLPIIRDEFQKDAALDHVARIAGFHRIQASPGYRGAAEYVFSSLKRLGVDAEILSFPAREGARWWSQAGFKEWSCDDAELVLLEDGKRDLVCSFQDDKISLIQRSAPTSAHGIQTSIVYVEKATEPSSYEGIDVAGKIVFSRGDVQAIAKIAVDRFGAAGIVVDNMGEFPPVRDRLEIPDARQYTSFWPMKTAEFKAFGFVLSPRQGEALRKRFTPEMRELRAFARVDSAFYDGAIEDVTALIPGATREEVVAIAHLCHPRQSANDNASGSGVLVEAARTLSRLVREGRLPRPRRAIRFLWVPEMTGSYMYLASNEGKIGETAAAINLDMVGENQGLCEGSLLVEKPPKALPGFGGDLAESVLRALAKEAGNLAGTSSYALFKWAVTPFSGGSDHYIWADPTVGVTCPMLIQWPDKYYHTSQDTIDKVDPRMLHVAGTLTATYLYFAASASPQDAACLAGEMASHFPAEAEDALAEAMRAAREAIRTAPTGEAGTEAVSRARRAIERRVEFLEERKALDIESLVRLTGTSDALSQAQAMARQYVSETACFFKDKGLADLAAAGGYAGPSSIPPAWAPAPGELEDRAASMVPERVYRGPLSSRGLELSQGLQEQMEVFQKKNQKASRSLTYVQYWADGKRNVAEIADRVEGETGRRDLEVMVDYVDLMAKCGVFRLKGRQ